MNITIETSKSGKVHAVISVGIDPFGTFVEKWFDDMRSAILWVAEKTIPNYKEGEWK